MSISGFFSFLLATLLFLNTPSVLAVDATAAPTAESDATPYPFSTKLEGPTSQYTDALFKIANDWPAGRRFCNYKNEPLKIQMVRIPTEDRPYYVGFKKCMVVNAPMAAVAAVMDDFDHYEELFPGDKYVKVAARDKNKTTLAWERKIPVFFVPNVKYEMTHVSVTPRPGLKMYRAQLKKGDRLHFSDAMVVIEAQGPNQTLYTDYEFYEADFALGLFGIKAVGEEEAWKESVQGSYLSLLAIRFKAEHDDWSYPQISKAAAEAFRTVDIKKGASGKLFE